jgi:hypothetical protein
MGDLCKLIWWLFADLFRSRAAMEAEILVLRHQLNVLRRKSPRRVVFSGFDRMAFAGLYALAPIILNALQIVKPNTVIRWHRAGFRAYWRWKSRSRGGRPKTAAEIRQLIREMSIANPLWAHPASTANCSSWASRLGRPRWQSTWRSGGGHPHKAGRPSFTITPTALPRWTSLWCRRFRFGRCMDC